MRRTYLFALGLATLGAWACGSSGGTGNGDRGGSNSTGGGSGQVGGAGGGTATGGGGSAGSIDTPTDASSGTGNGGAGGTTGSGGAAGRGGSTGVGTGGAGLGGSGGTVGGRDAGAAGAGGGTGPSDGGSSGGTVGGSGESTAVCTIPTLPEFSGLQANTKMPDPFKSLDGTRISTVNQWACRRAEIAAQAQKYELGPKPAKPATVTGTSSGTSIVVNVSDGSKTLSFTATISVPTTGSAPYPAMIAIGGSSLPSLASLGVASITFPNDDIAQQNSGSSRGMGKFFTFYGTTNTAGAMIAWAWGVSRLIDALETTPAARIDTKRLGVTGCSRNGKGALIAGAFDERISLTIPQESGSGGAASWRVSDAQKAAGANIQTLGEITGENVWFESSFSQFNSAATRLPFDHHMVEGLVAPRAMLLIENNIDWLGPVSTFDNSAAGHTIWEALGIPDRMGFSMVGGHAHCAFPAAQMPELTAFVQKFLVGNGTGNTTVLKNDQNITFDKATWIDWTTPALQ